MSRPKFGTDGIRGVAGTQLTPELALLVGKAVAQVLASGSGSRAVMGRDTRKSGSMVGAAVAAGLASRGVDVRTLGIVPTGLASFETRRGGFDLGVVISASHNPAEDNGIKVLGPSGAKLDEDSEQEIESLIDDFRADPLDGLAVGGIELATGARERYCQWLESLVPEGLAGLRIAMDCAHGAAYEIAPSVFRQLGAEVVCVGVAPDGLNINAEGGATKPHSIQKLTQESRADLGISFDGDADRAVFSDSLGRLFNGDRMMAIWAGHWRREGRMASPSVIGTVMSNGGFAKHLSANGLDLQRAKVGDRNVTRMIGELGAQIGGEQSGHVIFPELGPTGDGLVTALELVRVLKREGKSLADHFDDFDPWPQILVNVNTRANSGWDKGPKVSSSLTSATARVGSRGRVVVRASGTQPMVRVMVEADDQALRDEACQEIVDALCEELGGTVYSTVDLTYALGD